MNVLNFIKGKCTRKNLLIAGGIVLAAALLIAVLCLRGCGNGPDMGTDPPDQFPSSQDTPSRPEPSGEETTPQVETTEPTDDPETTQPQPSDTQPATEPPTDPDTPTKPVEETKPGTPDPETVPAVTTPVLPEPVTPDSLIKCKNIAVFSGSFVEDGSDEPVENVAAMLVTNESDQYLDLATLVYDIDGEEGFFKVTGLPPGASAWVMEASRKTAKSDSVFTRKDCITSFRENAQSSVEGLSVQSSGTMLKVTNETGGTVENVTVYYKVLHSDGNYFGGITYMVSFGTLEPGQSAEKLAGHFKEGWTDIVRIGYQQGS